MPRRHTSWFALLLVGLALVVSPRAHAAFLSINGLSRSDLGRHKISVALVKVKDLTITWRTSYATSGHLTLELEDVMHGPRPAGAGLTRVPYMNGVGYNSAWPDLGTTPVGATLVMAWRNGHPCGEGSAVHLGERFSLPLAVTGPADPRAAAVKAILGLVSIKDDVARLKKLNQAYAEGQNPYLVLFADAALWGLKPRHRHSAHRYARLLGIVTGSPGADEELGWPLLKELTHFPPIREREAYDIWIKGTRGPGPDGTWPGFLDFRRLVQQRMRAFAANPKAPVDVRRWALAALAVPPAFVGAPRDKIDVRSLTTITERLRDPVVEVRRDAVRALLNVASLTRASDPATSRRLAALVRQAQRRETDPEERANIQLRLEEIQAPPSQD